MKTLMILAMVWLLLSCGNRNGRESVSSGGNEVWEANVVLEDSIEVKEECGEKRTSKNDEGLTSKGRGAYSSAYDDDDEKEDENMRGFDPASEERT